MELGQIIILLVAWLMLALAIPRELFRGKCGNYVNKPCIAQEHSK